MAEQSLKDKTVKGVAWSGIDNVAQFGVSFIVSIVLARLLSPDDYGLIGIITIFTTICNSLINAGFGQALIRKNNITDDDYNTVFFANLGISVFLYVILFVSSPIIAVFFDRVELILLIRVTTIGLIIGALGLVQQTRLTKRIDFKTQTKITLTATVLSGIIGILLAFLGCGVWSLVAQGLVSQSLRTILLWVYNKWMPSLCFSMNSFRELFGFGWKMMVSGVLANVWQELYQVVIGKYYSPASLGQYTRAKHFSDLLSSNVTNVVQRVTYPVLSEIQNDKNRMVDAYRRIIKTTMFITTISMFFLGAISQPLIYCLIGAKWHEASAYLPIICIIGSLYPLHAINLNMLQVQGRSDLFLKLEIVKKIIGIAPIAIGIVVGIMPMLYAGIIVGVISFFLNSYYSGRILGYSSWMQIVDIAPSYIIATIIAVIVWPFKYIPVTSWIVLLVQLFVGMISFILINNKIKLKEYQEIREIVDSQALIKKLFKIRKYDN